MEGRGALRVCRLRPQSRRLIRGDPPPRWRTPPARPRVAEVAAGIDVYTISASGPASPDRARALEPARAKRGQLFKCAEPKRGRRSGTWGRAPPRRVRRAQRIPVSCCRIAGRHRPLNAKTNPGAARSLDPPHRPPLPTRLPPVAPLLRAPRTPIEAISAV